MKKLWIVGICLAALSVTPAVASDDDDREGCGVSGSAEWMSMETLTANLTGLGYEVRGIERDDGCYEVYALDQNRHRVELYVNPVSGEIVKTERES